MDVPPNCPVTQVLLCGVWPLWNWLAEWPPDLLISGDLWRSGSSIQSFCASAHTLNLHDGTPPIGISLSWAFLLAAVFRPLLKGVYCRAIAYTAQYKERMNQQGHLYL